jgi:hypothetical protein
MRLQMIRPKLVFLASPHQPSHMADTKSVDLFIGNVRDGAAINVSVERVQDQSFKLRFEPEHIPKLQKEQQLELALRDEFDLHNHFWCDVIRHRAGRHVYC